MSAFFLYRRDHDTHLFTDKAFYTEDGTIIGFHSKVKRIPVGIGVLWSRGSSSFQQTVWNYIDIITPDFDYLVVDLAAAANGLVAWDTTGYANELGLTGWSAKRNQLESYLWCSHEPFGQLEPGKLHLLTYNVGTPNPNAKFLSSIGWPDDPGECGDLIAADPRSGGLNLFEAMRRSKTEDGDFVAAGGYCVGGGCELTTITADGVTMETLRTWPDRVGHKIRPEPVLIGGRDVDVPGLNRHQRRALAAECRQPAAVA